MFGKSLTYGLAMLCSATMLTAPAATPARADDTATPLACKTYTEAPELDALVKAGYDPKSGVELRLKAEAVAQGKPVRGLETLSEQLHYFADMPLKTELAMLDSSLDEATEGPKLLDTMIGAWEAGDVRTLDRLSNAAMIKKSPELYAQLVSRRNARWASQLDTLLKGDGTLRVRPRITSAPATVVPGQSVKVTASTGIGSFALVREGSATHAIDTDERRVPVPFTADGSGSYRLRLPGGHGTLIPGRYLLFALNSLGTPSVAAEVSVG